MRCLVPYAGFIATDDVQHLARSILKEQKPTEAEKGEACRIARGPLYRQGPWDERPAWRMTPLLHGTRIRRRDQLLLGKRLAPSPLAILMGLLQKILIEDVGEVSEDLRYTRALCGMTYFGTRGMISPPGKAPDLGAAKFSKYRLNVRDYSMVGTVVLNAAKALGFDHRDRKVRFEIARRYLEGVQDGFYKPVLYPPSQSRRTAMPGDHPFRWYLPDRHWVPSALRGKIANGSGKVDGVYCPELWTPAGRKVENEAKRRQASLEANQRASKELQRLWTPQTPRPGTGWIFN